MAGLTLKVEDMSCGHCVAAIQGALEKVPGFTGMEAELETKSVTVTFQGEADQEAVLAAVREAGYTPEVVG